MNWQVYYGDGAVVRSDECAVQDIPALDAQVVLQYDPVVGWHLQSGSDYYFYCEGDGLWRGCDVLGLWDYLQQPGWKRVLFGRTIRSGDYHRIFQSAINDRNELRNG